MEGDKTKTPSGKLGYSVYRGVRTAGRLNRRHWRSCGGNALQCVPRRVRLSTHPIHDRGEAAFTSGARDADRRHCINRGGSGSATSYVPRLFRAGSLKKYLKIVKQMLAKIRR